jgi:hypothetical protein
VHPSGCRDATSSAGLSTNTNGPHERDRVSGTHNLAGVTSNPDASWVTQQARNFVARWDTVPFRFLIRDRDAKYASAFDEIFLAEGMRIVRTPIKAPRANVFAERFVGTLRRGASTASSS